MTRPSVAVVIPAYNAEATLPACLAAIAAMTRPADQLILYNDGATDRTEAIALAAGAKVIRNDGSPRGPAYGRNAAAFAATADLLLFVDADVVVAPDALERLVDAMTTHGAAAAFGSYDDRPHSSRVTSLYYNLRHHFIHQTSAPAATTFWSGLGLIDRGIFFAVGAFDAELFDFPSIEDVELGTRLIAAGHTIRLEPRAQGKHWKDWSLWRVWHTDVVRRAYPWSCLLADGLTAGADLNITAAERGKALLAVLVVPLLLLGFVSPWFAAAAAAVALLYIWLNRALFGFFATRLSLPGLAGAGLMHWCHHVYATATYIFVRVQTWLRLRTPRTRRSFPAPMPAAPAKIDRARERPSRA